MEQNNQTIAIGTELMRIARRRKTGTPRFRLPLPTDAAAKLIGACYYAEVESRGRDCELTDNTLDKITRVAESLTAAGPKFGLMLVGRVGNGKTTMLRAVAAAARHLWDMGRIDTAAMGYNFCCDFGMRIRTAKELAQLARTDWERFRGFMDTPLLGVDELGEEARTVLEYGNAISPMQDLFEHRYSRQLYTAVTTNLDPREIAEKYGARIADRFREMLDVVVFDGPSFRR